jgi:hypothetical protein
MTSYVQPIRAMIMSTSSSGVQLSLRACTLVRFSGLHLYGEMAHRFAGKGASNNTYKSIRIISENYDLYYSVWCTNEHELYDLKTDPHQMHNLVATGHTSIHSNSSSYVNTSGRTSLPPPSVLLPRLNGLLLVLKSCAGTACTDPWKSLHPTGSVNSLSDALNPQYDEYYTKLPQVAFERCELGYLLDAEGPQWGDVNVEDLLKREGAFWWDWV